MRNQLDLALAHVPLSDYEKMKADQKRYHFVRSLPEMTDAEKEIIEAATAMLDHEFTPESFDRQVDMAIAAIEQYRREKVHAR